MKTILYIDGFNFYYGAARRFNVRWVNPLTLAQLLLPESKTVGLINPQKRPSRVLSGISDFTRQVRRGALEASQFPDELEDAEGAFHKPASW